MRGPTVKVMSSLSDKSLQGSYSDSSSATFDFGVGKELLYNISMISDIVSQEYLKANFSMKSLETRIQTASLEITDLEQDLNIQLDKLKSLQDLKSQVRGLIDCAALLDNYGSEINDDIVFSKMIDLLSQFTYEKSTFGLHYILYNSLSPSVMNRVSLWEPLNTTFPTFSWWNKMKKMKGGDDSVYFNEIDILLRYKCEDTCSSKVMRAITSKWNARDPNSLILMIDDLRNVLTETKLSLILEDIVLPKLTTTVDNWDPTRDEIPIHMWLHPWLPYLNVKLTSLFPEIRRKLSRVLTDWKATDLSAYQIIRPWFGVFDRDSMDNFLTRAIVPKLLEYVKATYSVSIVHIESVLIWYDALPRMHFLALLYGEFFPRWFNALLPSLKEQDYVAAGKIYVQLRTKFKNSLLREDLLYQCFEVAIDMIKQSFMTRSTDGLDALPQTSYQQTLHHLDVEKTKISKFNSLKKQVFAENSSFKNVIEAFAENHGVTFIPKSGRFVDGKQIWLFGSIPMYIEHDVAFTSKLNTDSNSTEWYPVTLEDLLTMMMNSTS